MVSVVKELAHLSPQNFIAEVS